MFLPTPGGGAQAAIDLALPMGGEHQAFFIGQDEHLQGRLAAVDLDDFTFQRGQPRQGRAVQAQDAVQAMFDAGEQPGQQHQGLIPRCTATMPLVMLW